MRKKLLISFLALLAIWFSAEGWRSRAQTTSRAAARNEESVAFRLVFGEDRALSAVYDGSLSVQGGRLVSLASWRFFGGDKLVDANSWKLAIKRGPMEGVAPAQLATGAPVQQRLVPAGLVVTVSASTTSVAVGTRRGEFRIPVAQLRYGRRLLFLGGEAAVERVPVPARQSADGQQQHDYPSLAVCRDGSVWYAWQSYRDRGDHVYARMAGRPEERITTAPGDVFGTAIAEDGGGRIHVAWAQRSGEEWHLWERVRTAGNWAPAQRITSAHSPNFFHKIASGPNGELWLVWAGYREGRSFLYAARHDGDAWSEPFEAGGPGVWSPDAAVDREGNLHLAWDSYAAGNYDVFYRRLTRNRTAEAVERITATPRFEAHPSIAIDPAGRPWIAWDESGPNWGKDWNHEDQNRGTILYADRSIRVAAKDGGKWMQAGEFAGAVPDRLERYAQLPRLAFDGAGRAWVLFQVRTSTESTHEDGWATGGLWDLYLTTYDGDRWRPAAFVPQSTARPEVPFRVQGSKSGVWMTWATDGRTYRGRSGNHELPTMAHYDVYSSYASTAEGARRPVLSEIDWPVVRPQVVHADEKGDVERIRGYRVKVNDVEYRIVRGDFHRHTEISYDGAGDGSVEDYFRYMLDGASMDTGILGDHNMGGDAEYSWWRTEKAYDLFHIPGRFTPLFGYERSVRYPNGHRNVIFDHRGVRTLPIPEEENQGRLNSGKLLYPYLRQNRGICMEHSMATNQGTDYRDNDPQLEPLVEIYQGYHASAEYAGAPRAETETRQLLLHGPFRPAGFWWNALAKGYRLGVHASSDHISTHCSYAMVLTPAANRKDIVENMRKRHAYAATDNIILDFQADGANGERHLMGDDFAFAGRPTLHARIVGSSPIASVELIRNGEFVYTQRPARREFDFSYVDASAKSGDNWYYVRVMQDDGNLAWSSPIWIRR